MNKNKVVKRLKQIIAIVVIATIWPGEVYSLPQVGEVVSGSAEIQYVNETTLNINAADNTIINYTSFNIGLNETVNVNLPSAESQILNRVLGGGMSEILGALNTNGLFILVNPEGVRVGSEASIIADRLVLSTRDITNQNFISKTYIFEKLSEQQRDMLLLNEGTITIRDGGFGVLIAGGIENTGSIVAPVGKVALAAGDAVRLDISGDGLISVAIEEKTASTIYDRDGKPISDQIKNSGTIEATGGTIILDAESLSDIFSHAINLEGIVRADTAVVGEDGSIQFVTSGDIYSTGTISAQGGSVDLKAEGDIVSQGKLIAQFLDEYGAAFVVGGNYIVGQAFVENLDDAITLTTGNYSGTTSDIANVTLGENAVITLIGDTVFTADSDASGAGAFGMVAGSSIVGGGYNLTLSTSGNSTLRSISGLGSLTLNRSASTTPTYTMNNNLTSNSGTVTIPANVTLNRGSNTLTTNNLSIAGALTGTSGAVDVNGSMSLTGTGSFTQDSSTLNIANGLTLASGTTFTKATGGQNVTFDETGTITDNNGAESKQDLGSVVIGGTSTTLTLGSAIKMTALTVNSGNIFSLAGYNFQFSSATNVSNSGTFRLQGAETLTNVNHLGTDGGTVEYVGDGDSAADTFTLKDFGTTDYYNLKINTTDSNDVIQSAAAKNVAGTLMITSGSYDANGYTTDASGLTTVNGGTYLAKTQTQTLNAGLTVSSGTFTGSSGTVDVNGGDLTYSGGTFTAPSGNLLIVQNFNLSGGSLFSANGGTVVFDGSTDQTLTTNAQTFNHLTLNNTGTSGSDDIIISGALDVDGTLTITDGDLDLGVNNPNINTAGDVSIAAAGSVTTGTGTWTFDGSGTSTLGANSQNLGNAIINGSSKTIQLSNAVTFGTLTIGSDDVFDLEGNNSTITTLANNNEFRLQGSETVTITNMDTDSGTTVYDGTGTYTSLAAGANYYHLQFNGSGGSWTTTSHMDVDGNLTITSGTFNDGGKTINLAGNWSNSGTLTATGKLILDGGDQTISGSSTFNHLTKTPASQQTLTFDNAGTQTISGILTLEGSSTSNRLLLRSNLNGEQWEINPTGTRTVAYLDVRDSHNLHSNSIDCTTGCLDSLNNTRWLFEKSASSSSNSTIQNGNTVSDRTIFILPFIQQNVVPALSPVNFAPISFSFHLSKTRSNSVPNNIGSTVSGMGLENNESVSPRSEQGTGENMDENLEAPEK